ncbi:MAG TPA: CoA-transferase [candidate division Zixibacteria bacterium]|nr:CoA-transferase [candidate division Zixibacteria bacterium]
MDYTLKELMVAAAAREIRDGERVFVGMRLPLLGFAVAKELHAPNAIGLFENGVIRDWPALAPIFTMSDPPNVSRALCCCGLLDVMALLQSGRVELGFIGGAEIDRYGNLNTHWVEEGGRRVRLPGSGGAADIASLAGRCVVIMNHERRRFPEKARFITSPGHGEGKGWREMKKLKGRGPARVITSLGIFSFDPETREMVLDSYHPGVSVEKIRQETGWELKVAADAGETRPPSADELAAVRKYDPQGVWTR